ncbi:MAG: cysteine hydrolase family protein [Bryobacteraceae bacterium]
MTRRNLLALLPAAAWGQQDSRTLQVRTRTRKFGLAVEQTQSWKPAQTAIIVCDMWNGHYCKSSARRVGEIAPRMNEMLGKARAIGVHIIHAPSGCMEPYAATPQRKRMMAAKAATPPVPIAKWCYLSPAEEGQLPIDDTVSPCDDDVVGPAVRQFDRQHPALEIKEPDGVSDSGPEIYNFFEQEGVRNVVLMGVHTNMCVLGRPFGIRQMVRLGRNVVLARDMTDAMYDPREAPWVSHWRGVELVIEHVEEHWCPSISSTDLTSFGTAKS